MKSAATASNHPDIDVLVLGAGAAGLAAARCLAEAGRQVVIVEATRRIGGRIRTQHVAGHDPIAIELGAEFVHGRPPILWKLLGEAQLQTLELSGSHLYCDQGRLGSGKSVAPDASEVLEAMSAWVEAQPDGIDEPFSAYLRHTRIESTAAARAAAYVEGFNAADRDRIGIAGLARQQRAEDAIEGDRLFHVSAGYGALPAYLLDRVYAAGGRLLPDHAVQRIEWSPYAVKVSGRTEGAPFDLTAKRTVIALPLGVLQSAAIRFSPEPQELLHAVSRLAFGHAIRISLLFDAKYWPEDMSFLYAPQALLSTWWTPMPSSAPLITAWAGGTRARDLAAGFPAATAPAMLRAEALNTLSRIVGVTEARLEAALISHHVHEWGNDPLYGGAYSYVPAGALDAAATVSQPVGDTLFLAGEHTDLTGHWGTVHGALASGERAARQILASPIQ